MTGAILAAAALALLPRPEAEVAPRARSASTFPEMEINRSSVPHEWPFSVDAGTLTCVPWQDQMVVIFSEPWRTDVPQEFGNMTLPRSVIVSANPFAIFASFEDRALFLPFDSFETLIRRLAPFEAMGTRLCGEEGMLPGEAKP